MLSSVYNVASGYGIGLFVCFLFFLFVFVSLFVFYVFCFRWRVGGVRRVLVKERFSNPLSQVHIIGR